MADLVREIITRRESDTFDLGLRLGRALETGCVIALEGGLGAGKTCFARGLARGLGIPQHIPITSPSYTIVNEYPARLTFRHADLYRLAGGASIEDMGFYELADPQAVVAVEWADRLDPEDLEADITVRFSILDDTGRKISLEATGQQVVNLLNGVDF